MDRPAERLALIECLERDGRPGRAIDVLAWPLTLGRALDNHVVIDDPHVAARHARLAPDAEGRLQLEVLDTVNGLTLDGRHLAAGARAALPAGGAALQLGQTRLRLRRPGEVLAPEQPLPDRSARVLLLLLPLTALLAAERGIELDPGAEPTAWLSVLVMWPLVLALWCSVWALLSKVFQHRFEFMAHLRIALPWLLALELADVLLPQLGASLAFPALWRSAGPVKWVLAAFWLHAHLALVLPHYRRMVAVLVGAAAVGGAAVMLALVHRDTDSWSRSPYMSTLPLPALRWSVTVAPTLLVDDIARLGEPLAARAREARREEDERGGADLAAEDADDGD